MADCGGNAVGLPLDLLWACWSIGMLLLWNCHGATVVFMWNCSGIAAGVL